MARSSSEAPGQDGRSPAWQTTNESISPVPYDHRPFHKPASPERAPSVHAITSPFRSLNDQMQCNCIISHPLLRTHLTSNYLHSESIWTASPVHASTGMMRRPVALDESVIPNSRTNTEGPPGWQGESGLYTAPSRQSVQLGPF
jgi:hypothetical protein